MRGSRPTHDAETSRYLHYHQQYANPRHRWVWALSMTRPGNFDSYGMVFSLVAGLVFIPGFEATPIDVFSFTIGLERHGLGK